MTLHIVAFTSERVTDALRLRHGQSRRGFTTVYAIALMTGIVAFCSLGADYGRVQLAKSELRPPVVGITGITLGAGAAFASYDSNVGLPGGANVGNAAALGSNSSITLGSTSSVRGDINLGPAGVTSIGSGFFTTGTTNRMTYTL